MALQDHPDLLGGLNGKLPHSKKPKFRAPRGLRDKLFFPVRALPTYTGPYSIGTMEIEVPVEHPRHFSHISRHKQHLLQLETVLMTIYYPAARETHYVSSKHSQYSRQLWLGRPRLSIAGGYARFAGLPEWLGYPVFSPAMFTKLPAYRNAPLADYWAPAVSVDESNIMTKDEGGEKPEGASDKPVFPLVMFSHGLGGTRTMYSSVCGEFASYGFVVCAVEHRDGSGPRTYINHPRTKEKADQACEKGEIDHTKEEERRGYGKIDYIFPKDNPSDTSPNNDKGVDQELRNAQIDLRCAEIEEAYKVMEVLVSGNGHLVAERNIRQKGYKASSSHGLEDIDWNAWQDRVRLENITACGHSFGAATVTNMLRQPERWPKFTQGIIYDIWGGGTKPADDRKPCDRISRPLLALNSEAFTYWPSNYELVDQLINETQLEPHPAPSWLLTVRGTVHVSQSDFSLLYPHLCSVFLKMVANPQRALDLNINASLEFLSHILPPELAQVSRAFKNENLLKGEVSPLDKIPKSQLHRPETKFVAARLRIQHEWLYRLSPKLFRRWKRRNDRKHGRPTETGDEVWLHSKPTAESIARYLEANCRDGSDEKARRLEGALPLSHELSARDEDDSEVKAKVDDTISKDGAKSADDTPQQSDSATSSDT